MCVHLAKCGIKLIRRIKRESLSRDGEIRIQMSPFLLFCRQYVAHKIYMIWEGYKSCKIEGRRVCENGVRAAVYLCATPHRYDRLKPKLISEINYCDML